MTVSNFGSLTGLEHTFLVGSGRVRSDDRYSDNRATSVQLGWDLTELGKKRLLKLVVSLLLPVIMGLQDKTLTKIDDLDKCVLYNCPLMQSKNLHNCPLDKCCTPNILYNCSIYLVNVNIHITILKGQA